MVISFFLTAPSSDSRTAGWGRCWDWGCGWGLHFRLQTADYSRENERQESWLLISISMACYFELRWSSSNLRIIYHFSARFLHVLWKCLLTWTECADQTTGAIVTVFLLAAPSLEAWAVGWGTCWDRGSSWDWGCVQLLLATTAAYKYKRSNLA